MRIFSLLIFIICLCMQGCAESVLSRDAQCAADNMYGTLCKPRPCASMDEIYQNGSSVTKGMLMGGGVGGVAGSLTEGIGLVPGLMGGVVLGGALGAFIEEHSTLLEKLRNRGVKVIILGDQVLIVLQSAFIFQNMTPALRATAPLTLNLVVCFVNCFKNMSIQVVAYANDMGMPDVMQTLTTAQANTVAKYLWHRGIETRLLTSQGAAGAPQVECNNLCGDNYRVEIRLEKLIG